MTDSTLTPTYDVSTFDPRSVAFRVDPYPTYDWLRSNAPVHWSTLHAWLVTRHADVTSVLLDDTRFTSQPPAHIRERMQERFPPNILRHREVLLFRDGPEHARLRGLVGNPFSPRRVERFRRLVEAKVSAFVEVARNEATDAVANLAGPVPEATLAALLGLPLEDMAELDRATRALAAVAELPMAASALAAADNAHHALYEYFSGVCTEREGNEHHDDLISEMVARQRTSGGRYSRDEVVIMSILMLFAGHGTTTNLLANTLFLLGRHPAEMDRLRQDRGLASSAIEEVLRMESPLQLASGAGRWATTDVELAGTRIEPGQRVVALIGAANRDPAVFDTPNRFDIARHPNRHLAFSHGAHFCLGASFARMQGSAMAEVLAGTGLCPTLVEPAAWRPTFAARSLSRLPVLMLRRGQ